MDVTSDRILLVPKQTEVSRNKQRQHVDEHDMHGMVQGLRDRIIDGTSKKTLNLIASRIEKSWRRHQQCVQFFQKNFNFATLVSPQELNVELTNDFDWIVALGGDEHFKYVFQNAREDVVFFNVCSDPENSEAVLAGSNRSVDWDEMPKHLHSGNYSVEGWTALEVFAGNQRYLAMDAIYIGTRESRRMSHYILKHGSVEEEQKSSGVLVSTGAGSTGWFLSAGGFRFPAQNPVAYFLVREPYFGTNINTSEIESLGRLDYDQDLIIDSLMLEGGVVNIDFSLDIPFECGDKIRVKIAPNKIQEIQFNSH